MKQNYRIHQVKNETELQDTSSGEWKCNTGYIKWRMKQNYRIYQVKNETELQDTSSGEWKCNTGYIKWRMKPQYRIHLGENETAIQDTSSGEWKCNTGYIKWRMKMHWNVLTWHSIVIILLQCKCNALNVLNSAQRIDNPVLTPRLDCNLTAFSLVTVFPYPPPPTAAIYHKNH